MEKLHHIAVPVENIAEAINWYTDKFEITVNYSDDTWASLQFENIALALVIPGQHPPHIAVEKLDAERFGPLTKHRDGTASTYLSDPWGNIVEILNIDTKTET
jgi:catechol 2,3-dioxygenase-like lactoylglutathione lyase family enzyme